MRPWCLLIVSFAQVRPRFRVVIFETKRQLGLLILPKQLIPRFAESSLKDSAVSLLPKIYPRLKTI
jgi:hypothetical protein